MLAELAAANAAYATIKIFVLNGKEITDVLSPLKKLGRRRRGIEGRGVIAKRTRLFFPRCWAKRPMILTSFWRWSKWLKSVRSWRASADFMHPWHMGSLH